MIKNHIIFVLIITLLTGFSIISVGGTTFQESSSLVLDQLLQLHHLVGAHIGIAVRSLRKRIPIMNYNAQKYFCPASNEKLLLTFAALKELGPNYRFKTAIYVKRDAYIQGTTLYSDLLIKGYGDPTLAPSAIGEAFIRTARFKGIHKVEGSLRLDSSYFDNVFWGPGWAWDDNNYFIAAIAFKATRFLLTSPYNPARYLQVVGQQIKESFSDQGITFTGRIKTGKTSPEWQLVTEITSQPLQKLLKSMDYFSDNFIADQLFKSIGAHRYGQGTFQNGAQAVAESLNDIIHTSIKIVDGSGLSRYNLLTPLQLVELLSYAFTHPTLGSQDQKLDFWNLRNVLLTGRNLFTQVIPSWGEGTLATREYEFTAYAKTGTLANVSALSGYLLTRSEDVLAFSIIINDTWSVAEARNFQDDLLFELEERLR